MTGRTHDMAAFTALSLTVAVVPLTHMSLATGVVAVAANLIGGLAPDIDQPTAKLWHYIPVGSVIGRLIDPFLGGHRTISHSIIGVILFGFLAKLFLETISSVLLVNIVIVWWAFMIGFISHLIMDLFTHEGEPLLFPLHFHFGIPPIKALRIKTGGFAEKIFVFPGLIIITGFIYYLQYTKFIDFLKHFIGK
jgi:inner membrane protein